MPVGVFVPQHGARRGHRDRHRARPARAAAAARRRHLAVRPDHGRGAGHRHQQAPAQRARLRRGRADGRGRARHRARPPERAAEAARPVVPGRRVDQRAGHARRHGRQQLLRQPQHRLRQHGAQRGRHRGLAGRRPAAVVRAARGAGPGRTRDRRLRARPGRAAARRDRGALAEGDAPRGRLQPRHLPPAERAALHRRRQRQPGAPAGRRRGHAGVHAQPDAAARAAAARQGAGRRQLPDLPRRDGRGAAHRQARPDRGGAGRPHDDRAVARQPGVPADDRGGADRRSPRRSCWSSSAATTRRAAAASCARWSS